MPDQIVANLQIRRYNICMTDTQVSKLIQDYCGGDELWGPKFQAGEEIAAKKSETTGIDHVACIHCGKVMKSTKVLWVEIGGGGDELIPTDASDEKYADGGYMGCWAIGTTCGKSIPAQFIQRTV